MESKIHIFTKAHIDIWKKSVSFCDSQYMISHTDFLDFVGQAASIGMYTIEDLYKIRGIHNHKGILIVLHCGLTSYEKDFIKSLWGIIEDNDCVSFHSINKFDKAEPWKYSQIQGE